MAWDITIPTDGLAANTLHTIIQTAKKDIREIIWCWNGLFNEHNFFGGAADLKHPPSQVGFVGVFVSFAALQAFNPTIKGSLNFVLNSDPLNSGFYVLDSNGVLQFNAPITDHTLLSDTQAIGAQLFNDHTQYLCMAASGQVNGSGVSFTNDTMGGNLYLASTGSITFSGGPSGLMGDAVAAAHATAGWGDAHTQDGGLIARHFSSVLKMTDISTAQGIALQKVAAYGAPSTYYFDWILNFAQEDPSIPTLSFFPMVNPNVVGQYPIGLRVVPGVGAHLLAAQWVLSNFNPSETELYMKGY